jgi:hypothetical protein
MILGIANNGHADAKPRGNRALGNRIGSVVRAFGVDIGPQFFQESFHGGFGKKDNVINAAQGGDKQRASLLIKNGATGAFQTTDTGIRVDANDENVTFLPGALEITNMAYVERIEATVGEDHALSAEFVLREVLAERIACNDFGSGLTHNSRSGSGGFAANGFE